LLSDSKDFSIPVYTSCFSYGVTSMTFQHSYQGFLIYWWELLS